MIILSSIFFTMLLALLALEFTNTLNYSNLHIDLKYIIRTLMIVPLLALSSYNAMSSNSFFLWLLTVSLLLVIVADVLIIKSLIIGLSVFTVIHLLNGINFIQITNSISPTFIILGVIIFIAGLILYFLILFNGLSNFYRIVTFIYLFIILFSVWRAFCLPNISGLLVGIGYCLFFLCDFEVAYLEFIGAIPNSQIINHILYYGGLYLITIGLVIL